MHCAAGNGKNVEKNDKLFALAQNANGPGLLQVLAQQERQRLGSLGIDKRVDGVDQKRDIAAAERNNQGMASPLGALVGWVEQRAKFHVEAGAVEGTGGAQLRRIGDQAHGSNITTAHGVVAAGGLNYQQRIGRHSISSAHAGDELCKIEQRDKLFAGVNEAAQKARASGIERDWQRLNRFKVDRGEIVHRFDK